MNFLPELNEVKRIAATNQYKVIPISCELLPGFMEAKEKNTLHTFGH